MYLERKRAAERDAAEAAGQNLWTENLDDTVRGRLVALWGLCTSGVDAAYSMEEFANQRVALDTGFRSGSRLVVVLSSGSVDLVLSYIDAIGDALEAFRLDADYWRDRVDEIFRAHRVAFKLVDGLIVPLDSEELFTHVVKPVINLFHGRQDLAEAHQAYREALEEIAAGHPANAITDAGTALQTTLTVLGFSGNQLGDQVRDARSRGLLAPHDATLNDGIAKFLSWASADRSETGDAHKVTPATIDDAWLMVHIVGALIVRLVGGPRTQL